MNIEYNLLSKLMILTKAFESDIESQRPTRIKVLTHYTLSTAILAKRTLTVKMNIFSWLVKGGARINFNICTKTKNNI